MSSNKRTKLKRERSQWFQLIADLYKEHELLELPHDLGSDKECVYCRQFHTIHEILQETAEELRTYSDRTGKATARESRNKLTENDLAYMKQLQDEGLTKEAIAERMGVSRSTVYLNLSKLKKII